MFKDTYLHSKLASQHTGVILLRDIFTIQTQFTTSSTITCGASWIAFTNINHSYYFPRCLRHYYLVYDLSFN